MVGGCQFRWGGNPIDVLEAGNKLMGMLEGFSEELAPDPPVWMHLSGQWIVKCLDVAPFVERNSRLWAHSGTRSPGTSDDQ